MKRFREEGCHQFEQMELEKTENLNRQIKEMSEKQQKNSVEFRRAMGTRSVAFRFLRLFLSFQLRKIRISRARTKASQKSCIFRGENGGNSGAST